MTWKAHDLTGQTFGRLSVISRGENTADGKARWLCRCACGKTRVVRAVQLVNGRCRSCGCLAREMTSTRSRTHGKTNSSEWIVWRGMRVRCSDPSRAQCYGHVSVCDRWSSFTAFLEDMGPRPGPEYSIDRIDPTANYEPGNCRWATIDVQNRNKRSNVWLTLDGETMTAADWARRIGISQTTLSDRISAGWDLRVALTAPPRRWRKSCQATA